VLFAACGDPPPLTVKFQVTDGDVQSCTNSAGGKATTCADVTMLCDAVVSIRIFAPSDPSAPFISVCQPLLGSGKNKNVCQIAGVNLTPPAMPTKLQDLEVDMVVYPRAGLSTTPAGDPICPADVAFGGDGFLAPPEPCLDPDPANCPAIPAIGGRAFYHPGDDETVVTLGCADLAALEDTTCVGETKLHINASVTDFDTAVSVSPATADSLLVSIGEPTFDSSANGYVLKSTNTFALGRTVQGPVPAWGADVAFVPTASACVEVFEDGAQTTAAVACTNNITSQPLDLPGIRLSKATLDSLLPALPPPNTNKFPLQGMVIGKALTYLGAPAQGVQITPSSPTAHILYLSDDGTTFTASGITGTSGIWISLDATYPTVFHAVGQTPAPDGFGGLIAGKADIVIIQLKPPGTG
jgi:hypothetical protein